MSVLVTVGTTQFDDLIKFIDQDAVKSLIKSLGFSDIICQIGTGNYIPKLPNFRLTPSLIPFIQDAELIISHAGAGTILESLRHKKRLITVINSQLMHNHQSELAQDLHESRHLIKCGSPEELLSVLPTIKTFSPVPLPQSDRSSFTQNLRNLLI